MLHYRHQQQTQIQQQTPVEQIEIDKIQQTEESLGQYIVLFAIVTMFLGGILKEVHKKSKIPYTPLLLIVGVFFGYSKDMLGDFGKTTSIIQQLNPNLILLVFIPTLLFQSAYNCDWYVFKNSLINIIILAGPGLLWGAFMIGICFKIILQYNDLSWYQCLTLGCILSATDPVAVVSLLKQLGASLRFNTLVQGQSLMNDGASMVFFYMFLDLVKGRQFQPINVGANLIRISLGGPILGIIVGFATSYWLARVVRDPMLSINLTFISAYLCFYLSQFTFLKVSGILAVVCLGLYMSASSKGKMFLATSSALHNAWGYIQYSCQTIIFMITGIIIGIAMTQQSSIGWLDWLRLILFWILLIVTRAIMVLTFYPLISNFGYGLNIKQMVVLIYGGLRGALGLCLALMVNFDDKLTPRFRQLTIFYTCGIAMMTIIINGLTCGKLVEIIGMIQNSEIRAKMFKRSIQKILRKTQVGFQQLKNLNLAKTNWQEAIILSKALTLGGVIYDFRYQQPFANPDPDQSFISFQDNQALEQIRYRFTKYLKKIYHSSFHEGEISQQTFTILMNSCDVVNDRLEHNINYFQLMVSNFKLNWLQKSNNLRKLPIVGLYVTQLLLKKMFKIYETSLAFINSCEKGLKFFNAHFSSSTQAEFVQQQILQNMELAAIFLVQIETNYQSIVQAVQTTKIATMIIQSKSKALKEINQDGFIQENQYLQLMKQIDKDAIELISNEREFAQFIIEEKLSQFPIFSRLSQQQQNELLSFGQQYVFSQNSVIIRQKQPIQRVYFINSGIVKQQYKDYSMYRSVGCSISPYDIIYNEAYRCSVITQNETKITFFPISKIKALLDSNEQFKMNWYRSLFRYILKGPLQKFHFNKVLTQNQLRLLLEISQMKVLSVSQKISLAFGGYLFEGILESLNSKSKLKASCFIQSKRQFICCQKNAIIMIFKDTQKCHLSLTDDQEIGIAQNVISPLKPNMQRRKQFDLIQ